eukprot:TRINITY_DN1030_c0_g1_i1.p1 TRINITY_DN1030_c0_g1~~TRINITY_DN1030_c0_g1_i1.p1  ORF type:complete len:360 (+),score=51.70 TRINITY_DN1030_c0_g1_i1:102-1082(+)
MTFGTNQWKLPTCPEDTSRNILDHFVQAGGNFLDTSNNYGDSEEIVGRWMATKRREDLVLATKCRFSIDKGGPNDEGLSRKHIIASLERSLKRLQTDYVDLLQVHCWDSQTPLEETLRTLDDLIRVGKVRYIGCSNFLGYQLQRAIDLSKHLGLARFVCLQPQMSLLCRGPEWELLPVCRDEGVGIIPWSPLAGGLLTGKYDRNTPVGANTRGAWSDMVGWPDTSPKANDTDQMWEIVDTLRAIGKETGKSCAQIALRWLLETPGVTAPIIGAKSTEQLHDNIGATGWKLTEGQKARLDAVSSIAMPYPYRFVMHFGNRGSGLSVE